MNPAGAYADRLRSPRRACRVHYPPPMTTIVLASHVPMPWGNVDTDVFAAWGQWVGGIGSMLAVVALGLVTWFEARRRRREDEDSREAHARTVTAIVTRASRQMELGGMKFRPVSWAEVRVDNHGTLPILNVVVESVELRHEGMTYREWYYGDDPALTGPVRVAAVLGPGKATGLGLIGFEGLAESVEPDEDMDWTITISFVDAKGLRWRRAGNTLRRVLGQ